MKIGMSRYARFYSLPPDGGGTWPLGQVGCDHCGELIVKLVVGLPWDEVARKVAAHNHNVPIEIEPLFEV